MAGRQQQLDFSDAARLEAHLVRCGLGRVQAALVAVVFAEGELIVEGESRYRALCMSSRTAARKLRSTSPTVVDAARRVENMGLMRIVREGRGRPPLYIVDELACRSLAPLALDELVRQEVLRPVVPGGAGKCRQVPAPSHVHGELDIKNSCAHAHALEGGAGGTAGGVRQRPAPAGTGRRVPRRLRPWSKTDGFTDEELRAAVAAGDYDWFAHAFDQLVAAGFVQALTVEMQRASDLWQRFLALAHHAAREPHYHVKRKAMAGAIRRGRAAGTRIDVSRTNIADDEWARRMVASYWRDPELAALRLMREE